MRLPNRAGIPTEKGQSSQEMMGPKPSLPDSTEILTTLLHLKKDTENWERLKGQNLRRTALGGRANELGFPRLGKKCPEMMAKKVDMM